MRLLSLKDQRDIVRVIDYLVEIHRKDNTVEDVMRRFGISYDEYQMCSNLAIPALAQGNMKGRYSVVRGVNRAMREDIKVLYEAVKDDDGKAAAGVRALWEAYCHREQNAVYGHADAQSGEQGTGE